MARFAKVKFKIARGSCKSPRNCPSSESLWVRLKHCNSGLCEGELDNDPLYLRNVSRGESVLFHERNIQESRLGGLSGVFQDHPALPFLGLGALAVGFLMWRQKAAQDAVEAAGR